MPTKFAALVDRDIVGKLSAAPRHFRDYDRRAARRALAGMGIFDEG